MQKLRFLAQKEFRHILRDPRSLVIVVVMPIMMTFLYGYAISLDVDNIVIGVIDYDRTDESQQLIDRFYNSAYFSKPDVNSESTDPETWLLSSEAKAVMIIKPGFAGSLRERSDFSLGMIVDGSDNTVAAAVQNYASAVVSKYALDQIPVGRDIPGITISTQVLYNPDLESSHFFVPGLVAIILMMISALLTSITIAREKETGTMEQLLTAPVTPVQIIIGKILPYVGLALLDGILVLVFAKIVFGVPFVGSYLLLLAFGLIYVSAALSIGILISSLVKTQQVAMMFALVTTLLPSVMLSGLVFAIRNMPPVLQGLAQIVPAKYFVTVIRGIMLKGAGLGTLALNGLALLLLMAFLMTVAARKFNTRID
ncbi:MAG: ABC transporter permease [Candidatus Zixiibacteriota bacterium]|nr:MAG: ABC transporter permease [candidate division Zixibacteria bacterium]